jgi:Ca2+/Na+ antiporter
MGWFIILAIIVMLICYWAFRTLFWILIGIAVFVLLVWFVAKYFRRKREQADFLTIRRRVQQETQKRQEEKERIDKKEHEERELITSEIDKYLHKALQIMDTTSKWYNNEDEANRELVSVLKAQNIDAVYLHRLSNGRTADARVGNVLIEGKLSPDTSEIDRLIGQISDYVQYSNGNKINIVIYGELTQDAKNRIGREIKLRYAGQVFLSYLDNPQRLRKE